MPVRIGCACGRFTDAESTIISSARQASNASFVESSMSLSHSHVLLLAIPIVSCRSAAQPQGPAQRSPTPRSIENVVRAETVARGLEHPWGIAILSDGRMLVTERPGRLRLVEKDGRVSPPISGVPHVYAQGQGGLL